LPDAVPFALFLREFVNTGVGQRNRHANAIWRRFTHFICFTVRPKKRIKSFACAFMGRALHRLRQLFFRRNAAFNFNAIFIFRVL